MFRSLLVAFDPRRWPTFAHRIRSSRDATPAMLPIALFGTMAFSPALLSRIPYAHLALIILLTPLLVVSLIGAALAMCDSSRNTFRGGLRGFGGSESWFELARSVLIAGVLLSIATFFSLFFTYSVLAITGIPIATFFVLFSMASLIGYVLAYKRQPAHFSGSAYACVDCFFPQFLAGAVVFVPAVLFSKVLDPLHVVICTVVAASFLAVVLKMYSWKQGASEDAG